MRKIAIAAATAFLAAGSVACAKDTVGASNPPDAAAAAQGDIVGQAVFDDKGVQIGSVEQVATDETGAQTAIVSVGAYLGVGSRSVAIPTSELTAKSDGSGLTLAMSNDEIEALPAYETPSYVPGAEETEVEPDAN
jgi:sporulation protein YlmC with PRC-barrel domain